MTWTTNDKVSVHYGQIMYMIQFENASEVFGFGLQRFSLDLKRKSFKKRNVPQDRSYEPSSLDPIWLS